MNPYTFQATSQPKNHAKAILINSFPLALIFTLIYVPLLVAFVFKAFKNPTYVLWVTAFFCQVRVVSFAMRALLAKSESAGENSDLVLSQQIIYGVGFFGVLYSAYTMVLDRGIIKGTAGRSPLSRITGNRTLIRIVLLVAVSVGVTGAVQLGIGSDEKTKDMGRHLKTLAIVLYLIVAALLVIHTLFSIPAEKRVTSDTKQVDSLASHGLYILLLVGLLLLTRESFYIVTNNKSAQYQERLFYPFAAGTELAAVLMFLIPGLVPLKRELAEATMGASS